MSWLQVLNLLVNLDRALKDTCFWVLNFIELRKKKKSALHLTRLKVLFVGHKILLPHGAYETNILSDKRFDAKQCENGGLC